VTLMRDIERDRRDKRDKCVTQTTEKGVTNVTSVYVQCHCHALMSCHGRKSFKSELMVWVLVGLVVLLLSLLAFPFG
jgi:hypothetical protein